MPSSRRQFLVTGGATLVALASASLAGCLSDEPPTDGRWPRRAADDAHSGHTPTNGPADSLYEVWHRDRPDSNGFPVSPVVGDDRLYLAYSRTAREADGPGGSWLEAFDAATGKSLWKTELFRSGKFRYFYQSDSLVLDGDRIFVQTKAGLKTVGTDGAPQWTFENLGESQQGPDSTPPIVTDDVVVTATYGTLEAQSQPETVFGIDPADGSEHWRAEFPDLGVMGQLTASDGTVYVPIYGSDGHLVALDIETGEELWRRRTPVFGTPSVSDGRLFLNLRYQSGERYSLAAFDAESGSEEWRVRVGSRWPWSGLAVANGLVYLQAEYGLEARRAKSGDRVWRFGNTTPEPHFVSPHTTPVVAGDAAYAGGAKGGKNVNSDGQLFVVDSETGEERAIAAVGTSEIRTVPAVTEGLVFVNTTNGRLQALGECDTKIAGRCLLD